MGTPSCSSRGTARALAGCEISRLTLHAMLRHPWVVDLRGRRPALGPNGLRHADQSLEALSGLGLDNNDVYAVMRSIDEYVLGYGVRECIARTRSDEVHLIEYFDKVAAGGEYPYLAPLLRDGTLSKEHTFERGLKWCSTASSGNSDRT